MALYIRSSRQPSRDYPTSGEDFHLLTGDARVLLERLPAWSVQCVVTSPPYWGLRNYGVSGQIGVEEDPDAYVRQIVAVFQDVRRVLRNDGTVWLIIGDSYNASPPGNTSPMSKSGLHGAQTSAAYRARLEETQQRQQEGRRLVADLKPKDLLGIPWRVAFALQADGWYLRADIIWAKNNPMPESVLDRPTKAHEYVFLLTKQSTYYYDAESIAEVSEHRASGNKERKLDRVTHLGFSVPTRVTERRNKRSVWHIPTQAYAEAHFATFPEALVKPCVLAGSKAQDVVLDPFCGSGVTGVVALRYGRQFVGIELKPEYVQLAAKRIARARK